MQRFFDFLAILFNVATILGSLYAIYVLVGSFESSARHGVINFSPVIALSFVIIPYCLARTFRELADRTAAEADEEQGPCPACLSIVPYSATVCRFCSTKLLPTAEDD